MIFLTNKTKHLNLMKKINLKLVAVTLINFLFVTLENAEIVFAGQF